MSQHRHFIDGQWVAGSTASRNVNPSDLSDTVGEYAMADVAQLEAAVQAAQAAFPAWSASGIQARSDALDKIGSEILARRDELGTLLAREEGKTKPEAVGEPQPNEQFLTVKLQDGKLKEKGNLNFNDPFDRLRQGCHRKVYLVELEEKRRYTLELRMDPPDRQPRFQRDVRLDPYLRVEDSAGTGLRQLRGAQAR